LWLMTRLALYAKADRWKNMHNGLTLTGGG
jgi:hypothetical protein